ncbi:hypothetical protein Sango_3078000 [Sesamum angolense]|uniref:DUF4283 domain-containing protein n=1 Tax=Sesamum angolense TaxID=2727404 RepID=A0AAE1W0H4_9LAMI|nr:hypothetical protein Sango_3078000 [Sesamum angolense]
MAENSLCALSHTTSKTHTSSSHEHAAMADDGGDGDLEDSGHGAVSASPATSPPADVEPTMAKLQSEFNFMEFVQQASWVIDVRDIKSMAALMELKRQWTVKFGGEATVLNSATPSFNSAAPFPRASCDVEPSSTPEQAAVLNSAAPSFNSEALSPRALCDVESSFMMAPRVSERPLAANTFDASTPACVSIAACLEDETPLASLTAPTPLLATILNAVDGMPAPRPNHEIFAPPLPTRAAQPLVETRVSTPSGLTAPTTQPFLAETMVGRHGSAHPQIASISSSPAAQAVDRVSSPPWLGAPRVQTVGPPTSLLLPPHPPAVIPASTAAQAKFLPEILIGNVPLHLHSAFKVQNGEVLVRPSIDMIRAGSQRWNTTAVGYFLGKKSYFHHLNEFVCSIWPAVRDVTATSNGFFFFQFKTVAAMEEVIEGGPWLYLGQPIVLQKWEPGMVLRKLKHTEVPVCIKLQYLPVELWMTNGLSTVASGIGRPLYPDAITRACTRLDFARECIMLNVSLKLPKHTVIMMPNELGGESACKVDVEYEWLPPKCTGCSSLSHSSKECPLSKPTKPAVSIYVRKTVVHTPAAPELKTREQATAAPVHEVVHPVNVVDTKVRQGVLSLAAPPMFPHVEYNDMNVRA